MKIDEIRVTDLPFDIHVVTERFIDMNIEDVVVTDVLRFGDRLVPIFDIEGSRRRGTITTVNFKV